MRVDSGRAQPRAADAPWSERLARARPRRLLEVAVFDGQLDIVEHYGDGDAERLAELLLTFGLKAERRFHSPCG
jgi:hypothetical protein